MDTVIWPPKIALYNPMNQKAYTLSLLKEKCFSKIVEIKALPVPQGLLAIENTYLCSVTDAHYLAWVHVRPLEGRRLPKGRLKVILDTVEVLEGKITSFVPDPDPLDCTKLRSWKETDEVYSACALINNEAMWKMRLGYMAINDSKVEVYLSGVVAEEQVPLQITLVSALYTTLGQQKP